MITLLLVILSAISYAVFWVLQFHFSECIFSMLNPQQWWNPVISWENKWKNGIESEGEAFWGSSTIFVSITDAFHFFQSIYLWFTALAVVSFHPIITSWILMYCGSNFSCHYQWAIDLFIVKLTFQIIFQTFFGTIFKK